MAEAAVERARTEIAALIGADGKEIVFTSGATESINLALKGLAEKNQDKGNHIITAATEHRAVIDTCESLERIGYRVSYLPVDKYGVVSLQGVDNAMGEQTTVVSIMMANNEIGTIANLRDIGGLCKERGVVFHTDATQAIGKMPVDLSTLHIDLMSFSAHKIYGPKGIGALYIRGTPARLRLASQIDGGGHERGLRSGTLNVPAIVGFGVAATLAQREMVDERERLQPLRDRLIDGITSQLDGTWVNGHPTDRLPHNANITFEGIQADAVMMDMKDIAVSSGSACSSASPEPSHVLTAIGLKSDDALSSIRFGLGRFTTEEEIEYAIGRVVETVKAAREKRPHFQLTHS